MERTGAGSRSKLLIMPREREVSEHDTSTQVNRPGPVELRDLAIAIAAEVADRHAAGTTGAVGSKSTSTDPVTDVDRDSEEIVTAVLRELRPNDAILGEEGVDVTGTTRIRWIVDPLDGTVNYLYRFPAHAVSIAVEVDGQTVAGVVHDTALGVVYAAALGHGATGDGRPISPNIVHEPGQALLATGFAYLAETRAIQAATLARFLPLVRDIRRAGSSALDLCWTACGLVDAYYETGPNLWDVAAGVLIVKEAGGVASYNDGNKRVLAAGLALYSPLNDIISRAEDAS